MEGLQKPTVQNLRLRVKGGDFYDTSALLGGIPIGRTAKRTAK
jgi:hypothetical protein